MDGSSACSFVMDSQSVISLPVKDLHVLGLGGVSRGANHLTY